MDRSNQETGKRRKVSWIRAAVLGLFFWMPGKMATADSIDGGNTLYANMPESPWMETAVMIIVGLMVIFAVAAICYLHHQKKQDAQERMQREEAEREER